MTQAALRTHFDRSGLVRQLARLSGADAADAAPASIGARLGEWLSFNDAMTLFAALHGGDGTMAKSMPRHHETGLAAELMAQVERERAALTDSIREGMVPGNRGRLRWPVPAPDAPPEIAAEFAPYHRYYQAQQRELENRIGALRAAVRETLAARIPALRQLTALDGAFDRALAARERGLLAQVPFMLEWRFVQLRNARPASADADPAAWLRTGSWLPIFAREVQAVLLDELEMRLQPVVGLIETLNNKKAIQA